MPILADVVILRALPKTLGVLIVVSEGNDRSLREFFGGGQWRVASSHARIAEGRSAIEHFRIEEIERLAFDKIQNIF